MGKGEGDDSSSGDEKGSRKVVEKRERSSNGGFIKNDEDGIVYCIPMKMQYVLDADEL